MTERSTMGGTDGFRGTYDATPGAGKVNEETFSVLSAALVEYVQDLGSDGPVVVARDTRPSGEPLKSAVIDGIRTMGAEVVDLDVVPTPVAQKIAQTLGASATIVITASHNPVDDNGWKGMIGSDKPNADEVRAISQRYWDLAEGGFSPTLTSDQAPSLHEAKVSHYMDQVVSDIESAFGEKPLRGKRLVVDGAYGAGSYVTPTVLEMLGARVEEFACGEGEINKGVGAADLTGIKTYLQYNPELTHDASFLGAIANDGDADRVMAVGYRADLDQLIEVNGNHIMWAMAHDQPGIVGTEYTNSGLIDDLDRRGIEFEYCDNGDINVTTALRNRMANGDNWKRGGEFTGHLVDMEWLSSGDGVRAAAWFAAWAAQNGLTFGEVHQELPLWHERMEKFVLRSKGVGRLMLQSTRLQEELAKFESGEYGASVRAVARPSGTEPVFRLWAESEDKDSLDAAMENASRTAQDLAGQLWQ